MFNSKNLPPNSELEVLDILWKRKEATVREVYDELSKTKDCVYTSTLKTMQKMHSKGWIGRNSDGIKHRYYALVKEQIIKNNIVKEVIKKFFSGSGTDLALHALGNDENSTNADELKEIVTKLKSIK